MKDVNKIYCGDSRILINELEVKPKLMILHPPDQSEVDMDFDQYGSFLNETYNNCLDKLESGGVLCSITTDRKYKGSIYLKHKKIIEALEDKAVLFNYKIWAKTLKANLYVPTFCHILMFTQKDKRPSTQNKINNFFPDIWVEENEKIKDYPAKDSFSMKIIERIILTFTNPGDLIFDPFSGSGKSLKVASQNERKYIGIDINQDFCKMAESFIENG